jgi:dihydroxy-acid dehydratase
MLKPKIAVVNSSSELAICYAHLDGIAEMVKDEIRAAGGVPFEVRTAAPSDFITGAAKRGSYILAGRDIIANDIEVQVEAALLDGMICLTSCDKTPPGHLMAAARLNIPTILVIGGYQQAAQIDGEPVDVEDVWGGSIGERFGAKPKFPVKDMAENAIMGPGVCSGMATANTMHSVVEALGMCLAGHAPVRANSPKMQANARAAARRIVEMVHEDLKPRQIMTEGAFRNADRHGARGLGLDQRDQAPAGDRDRGRRTGSIFSRCGKRWPTSRCFPRCARRARCGSSSSRTPAARRRCSSASKAASTPRR